MLATAADQKEIDRECSTRCDGSHAGRQISLCQIGCTDEFRVDPSSIALDVPKEMIMISPTAEEESRHDETISIRGRCPAQN